MYKGLNCFPPRRFFFSFYCVYLSAGVYIDISLVFLSDGFCFQTPRLLRRSFPDIVERYGRVTICFEKYSLFFLIVEATFGCSDGASKDNTIISISKVAKFSVCILRLIGSLLIAFQHSILLYLFY